MGIIKDGQIDETEMIAELGGIGAMIQIIGELPDLPNEVEDSLYQIERHIDRLIDEITKA